MNYFTHPRRVSAVYNLHDQVTPCVAAFKHYSSLHKRSAHMAQYATQAHGKSTQRHQRPRRGTWPRRSAHFNTSIPRRLHQCYAILPKRTVEAASRARSSWVAFQTVGSSMVSKALQVQGGTAFFLYSSLRSHNNSLCTPSLHTYARGAHPVCVGEDQYAHPRGRRWRNGCREEAVEVEGVI